MIEVDEDIVRATYRYMRGEDQALTLLDLIFVFGNGAEQQRLAEKTAQTYKRQVVLGANTLILCAGGIGRGSVRTDIPESILLRDQLTKDFRVPSQHIYTETTSRNSGDNCRNGMANITNKGLTHNSVALVADAFAMRRMRAVFELEATLAGFTAQFLNWPTDRQPNFNDPHEQTELFTELLKVAD